MKKWRTAGLQVREGMQWNSGAGKATLKRVEQLGLFDKVNVELAASDSDCGDREAGIALHFRLKESPRQSADVNTEWSFLCNDAGRPDLVLIVRTNLLTFTCTALKKLNAKRNC